VKRNGAFQHYHVSRVTVHALIGVHLHDPLNLRPTFVRSVVECTLSNLK